MQNTTPDGKRARRSLLLMLIGFAAIMLIGDRILTHVSLPRLNGAGFSGTGKTTFYASEQTPPDVVFIGSSYSLFALNPKVVDVQVRQYLHRNIRSFNLSSGGATLLRALLVARRIVHTSLVPRLAYIEVSRVVANASRHDALENDLRTLGTWQDLDVAEMGGTSLVTTTILSAMFNSHANWNFFGVMVERLAVGARLVPHQKTQYDDRGWARWIGGRSLDPTPKTALPGNGAFTQGSIVDVALRRAIAILTNRGVEVRLIELPILPSVLHYSHESERDYRAFVERITTDLSVACLRVPSSILDDSDFFDGGHLFVSGAEKVSRWLAADISQALSTMDSNRYPPLVSLATPQRRSENPASLTPPRPMRELDPPGATISLEHASDEEGGDGPCCSPGCLACRQVIQRGRAYGTHAASRGVRRP